MRRKRNTAGVPYSSAGRLGAFAVLVAAIVMLALAAGYSDNSSNADNGGGARLAGGNELVSAQSKPGVSAAQRARAARVRARRAAMCRARVAVRRAAARRAALRRARRRRVTVTVTVIRPRAGSSAGRNLCAPMPRGRSRAARRARNSRRMQQKQALYNLNLHC